MINLERSDPVELVYAKVIVWNREGKLLVLRRSKPNTRRPLTWDFPGGLVEYGEDPRDAARREALEEAGLTLQEVDLVDVESANDPAYMILILFEGEVHGADVKLSWEHDQHRWVTPDELAQLDIPDKYKRAVTLALKRRSGGG